MLKCKVKLHRHELQIVRYLKKPDTCFVQLGALPTSFLLFLHFMKGAKQISLLLTMNC